MIKLDLVHTFVQVVHAGGFSAAARQMGMPRSTVSLQIGKLEAALGVRLLKRSTRKMTLTLEGRKLFEEASRPLEAVCESLSRVQSCPGILRGPIHLTAPADFPTQGLARAVKTFRDLHPEVRIQITLSNALLDLITGNVDIAVRMEGGSDMDAVQRKFLDFEWQFCASTVWIEQNGVPQKVEQITDFISPKSDLRSYLEHFILGKKSLPPATIEVENSLFVRDLILNNFGVGIVPKGLCENEIKTGLVSSFLEPAITRRSRLTLTFPTRADMTPRIIAFADHLCDEFGKDQP